MKASSLPPTTSPSDFSKSTGNEAVEARHLQAEHPDDFQQWMDDIPGAISQVLTTSTGLIVGYPRANAGCYRLLEMAGMRDQDNHVDLTKVVDQETYADYLKQSDFRGVLPV